MIRSLHFRIALPFLLGLRLCIAGQEWPEFRGPNSQGLVQAKALPLTWSEEKNVRWKTPIHGRAWSSPVVENNRVWLTTANEKGTELSAVCVDAESGKTIHDLKLFEVDKPQYAH